MAIKQCAVSVHTPLPFPKDGASSLSDLPPGRVRTRINAENAQLNPVLHDSRKHDRLMFDQSGLRAWKVRQAARVTGRSTPVFISGLMIFISGLIGLFVLAGALTVTAAASGDARAALERFLFELKSYSAEFQQTLVDETGFVLQEGRGQFALALPDQLRWEVVTPFAQVIVADGDSLWIHDPDLRQVTVRPMESALEATPLALLTQPQRLDERFFVSEMPVPDGYRLRLLPRSSQSDFTQLVIDLDANSALQTLYFDDVFGQRTTLAIVAAQRNPDIPATTFDFIPPPGTDVYRP